MMKFEMNKEEMEHIHNAKCSVVSVRKDLNSLFREDNHMNKSLLKVLDSTIHTTYIIPINIQS